jgi:hypothetical protein
MGLWKKRRDFTHPATPFNAIESMVLIGRSFRFMVRDIILQQPSAKQSGCPVLCAPGVSSKFCYSTVKAKVFVLPST